MYVMPHLENIVCNAIFREYTYAMSHLETVRVYLFVKCAEYKEFHFVNNTENMRMGSFKDDCILWRQFTTQAQEVLLPHM